MLSFSFLIAIIVVVFFAANLLLAVHLPDNEKLSPYECGYAPIYGQTRSPFTIQYYLVGLLFLIFDLEVSLLYPLGACLNDLSIYGFAVAGLFYVVLTLGFVVEIASGALHFTDQRASSLYIYLGYNMVL